MTDIAGRLFRFDPFTGAHISTVLLDNPEGVAYAANGDLYVAQRISNNVLRFPLGGGLAEEVIAMGAFEGSPADLEFGPDGLLYLSSRRPDLSLRRERSEWSPGRQLWDGRRVPGVHAGAGPATATVSLIAGFALAAFKRRERSARAR